MISDRHKSHKVDRIKRESTHKYLIELSLTRWYSPDEILGIAPNLNPPCEFAFLPFLDTQSFTGPVA